MKINPGYPVYDTRYHLVWAPRYQMDTGWGDMGHGKGVV